MKKYIYTLLSFVALHVAGNAATYYWIGGLTATSFSDQAYWTTNATSRAPVGPTGTPLTITTADIFIFDGSNVGGTSTVTGAVTITTSSLTSTPFAQLKLINSANVNITRTAAGSSVIQIAGDGTAAPDLVVDGNSTLTLGGGGYDYNAQIVLDSLNATGLISGTVYLSPLSNSIHTRSYITAKGIGSLVFASGASCHITDSTASSGFNNSRQAAILFQSGSSLYYYSGRSPLGNNSTTQFVMFELGSNMYIRGKNVSYLDGTTNYTSSSWTNGKRLANLILQNGVTYNADGAPARVENLTIDAGCTFNVPTSSQTPVLGDVLVNGIMQVNGTSTNALVMGGSGLQTISGSGTINIPSLVVADNSRVVLNKSITLSTACNVYGTLDFGNTGMIMGTSTFSSRVNGSAATVTGNLVAGSYQITGVPAGTLSGNTGLTITGIGIAPNTNVVGISGTNGIINLSKPVVTSGTGVSLSFSSDTATLISANTNGFDSTNGCVTVTGLKSFQSGTNYVINAATVHPIGLSSTVGTSQYVGTLTVNAPITTNYYTRVANTVVLNAGSVTIRPTDTIRITSGKDIVGNNFSSSKCFITSVSGNNVGALRIDSFVGAKFFPVGTGNNYMPVTVTPDSLSNFSVNVYEGATVDATPTGNPLVASVKSAMLDAVYNIRRNAGAGQAKIDINWSNNLAGNLFKTLTNNQIGIARYNGTSWNVPSSLTANAATFTVSDTTSSFGSFIVGQKGLNLPVRFTRVSVSKELGSNQITWQTAQEVNIVQYEVLSSNNGKEFEKIGSIAAKNQESSIYTWSDFRAVNKKQFYQIKAVERNGKSYLSKIVFVDSENSNVKIMVKPNPVISVGNVIGLQKGQTVILSDNTGKILMKKESTFDNSLSLDMSMLPSSTYWITIVEQNKIVKTLSIIKR